MEHFNINEHQQYLMEKNRSYKNHIDALLVNFRSAIEAERQASFEQHLKEIIGISDNLREKAIDLYNESIVKIKDFKNETKRNILKEMAQNALNSSFEMAQEMIENYVRDFK